MNLVKKHDGATIIPPNLSAPHERILICNGRVIDPANGIDGVLTIALDKGKIVSVSSTVPEGFDSARKIDAKGMWVMP